MTMKPTRTTHRPRHATRARMFAALTAVLAAALTLLAGSAPPAGAAGPAGGLLPVFTSAIDITSGRIQLRAVAPDRDSGKPIEVQLPTGVLPPKMQQLLATPLGVQMDQYWNVTPDKDTSMTPRQVACDGNPKTGKPGIKRQVEDKVRQLGAGYSAYNIVCNLATTGIVVTKQAGSTLYLSYQILNNTVEFYVRNPNSTCDPNSAYIFCPNDPRFTLRFASEIWTVVRTPDICHITAEGGTVNLHAVNIESHNAAAELAQFYEREFGDNGFRQAEDAIQATVQQVPLPLDDSFKDMRDSKPCTDRNDPLSPVITAFRDLETSIERADIVLRVIHPPIAAPRFQNVSLPYGPDTCVTGFVWREAFAGDTVCVTPETRSQAAADNAQAAARREPNGGAYGPNTCKSGFVWRVARSDDLVCVTPATRDQTAADNAQASARRILGQSVPSFSRPSISAQPIVGAGSTVQVNGQLFPPNVNAATALSLSLERDATAVCNGGATELEWGPAGGQMKVQRLPAGSNVSSCAYRYEAMGLTPATAYQFRARDCDAITCSPWSAALRLTTDAASAAKGKVVLSLDGAGRMGDGGTPLGTATVNDQGRFEVSVVIPAGTTAGMHTIYAVSGDANASTSVQVTASGTGGGKATIMLTGSFFGDTGCPTRPLPDYAQKVVIDDTFSLFGAGFAPGTVTIHLDSATGMSLGSATVAADGSFCRDDLKGPPASQVGAHTLVAVQNGTVQAAIPVTVIYPSVVK
jgi:hypothetical protein